MVKLRDPMSGEEFYTPPGGAIEASETALECAVRETAEETGWIVQASSVPPREVVANYSFDWNGDTFDCTTHFMVCSLLDPASQRPAPVADASYNLGWAWIELAHVERTLSFHPQIREAVLKALVESF